MNKNILWVVIGLLTLVLIISFKMKPQIIDNINARPSMDRPFTDDWSMSPGMPPATPSIPVIPGPKTYKEALAAASSGNKPLLLYFISKSCVPCQKMKSELAPSLPSVLNQLIWYDVDVEVDKEIVKKFNVTSTPTYIIVNGQEQILKNGMGYKTVTEFGNWLASPYQSPTPPPNSQPPQATPPPEAPPTSPPSQRRPLRRDH